MKIHFTDNTNDEIKTIFCLGLNYSEHIKEMSHQKSEQPVVFIKPLTAICYEGQKVNIPHLSQQMDYELEMVIYLKNGGSFLNDEEAASCIGAYGVGIDLTLRDLQKKAKEKGLPWTISKGFNHSAPISKFKKIDDYNLLNNLDMKLIVNGETKQKVNTSQMMFKPIEIISYLSNFFLLQKGDIIFTGTPSGVGKLHQNDKIQAIIDNNVKLNIQIN